MKRHAPRTLAAFLLTTGLLSGLLAGLLAGKLLGAVPATEPARSYEQEASPEQDDLLIRAHQIARRGLEYLREQQNPDRSFTIEAGERDITQAPLAVTALSALAFMASGSTMGRGPYKDQVRGAIEYLLDHRVEKVFPMEVAGIQKSVTAYYFYVDSDETSRMHGHGYATLALAQAFGTLVIDPTYGMAAESKARADQRRIREALVSAVRLIELSQSNAGGWFYDPYDYRSDDHEGSVTITMIQALRAARNVGVDINPRVIDDAVRYIHKSQRPQDGAFRYHLNSPQVSYALTAAAVATLNATGDYDSDVINLGVDYMRRNDPLMNPSLRWSGANSFPYYAKLYAAQAYYLYRDARLWERWHSLIVEDLGGEQDGDTGSIGSGDYGKVYSTAVSCLILQLPHQYLPIFQK